MGRSFQTQKYGLHFPSQGKSARERKFSRNGLAELSRSRAPECDRRLDQPHRDRAGIGSSRRQTRRFDPRGPAVRHRAFKVTAAALDEQTRRPGRRGGALTPDSFWQRNGLPLVEQVLLFLIPLIADADGKQHRHANVGRIQERVLDLHAGDAAVRPGTDDLHDHLQMHGLADGQPGNSREFVIAGLRGQCGEEALEEFAVITCHP